MNKKVGRGLNRDSGFFSNREMLFNIYWVAVTVMFIVWRAVVFLKKIQ